MPINSTSSAVSHQTRKQIRSKSRGLIFWVLHFQQKCVLEHRNWAANTFPLQKYIYELKKPFTRQQTITISGKTLTSKIRERRNHNSSREVLEGWRKLREKEKEKMRRVWYCRSSKCRLIHVKILGGYFTLHEEHCLDVQF